MDFHLPVWALMAIAYVLGCLSAFSFTFFTIYRAWARSEMEQRSQNFKDPTVNTGEGDLDGKGGPK